MKNFRQLALICGDKVLSLGSQWIDEELVVVIRPYLSDADGRPDGVALVEAAAVGDLVRVVRLLEMPVDPDAEAKEGHPAPSRLRIR